MRWWNRLPFFYGWVIVAVTFLVFVVGYATWHSFSIFYVAVLEDFGWTRAATAATFSIFTIVYGLNSLVAGGLVDRFGPRVMLPAGGVILGLGLLALTQMTEIWQFYVLFGVVVAVGLSTLGSVPSYAVLSNWFVRKRGTALGLATAGIGIGTLLLVPLLQSVIDSHGWRTAYLVLGLVTLLVIPTITAVFQRHRPQSIGLLPDGERSSQGVTTPESKAETVRRDVLVVDKEWASREWTLGEASRTRRFWFIFLARGLELGVLQLFLVHQAAFFVGMGFDTLVAATIVAAVGFVGSFGKILWGALSDRIGREISYSLGFSLGTIGVLILLSIQPGSPVWVAYAYAVVYGLCYGMSAVIMPALAADVFHGKRYGVILGGIYIGGGIGSAAGAFLGGYVYDLTQSYAWAFGAGIPLMWAASALYWLAAPRKVRMVAGRSRGMSARR
jgi:MFS family permease